MRGCSSPSSRLTNLPAEETERIELSRRERRLPDSNRAQLPLWHVSVDERGRIELLTRRLRRLSKPVRHHVTHAQRAGRRGIEPRYQRLECRLIPDLRPGTDLAPSTSRAPWFFRTCSPSTGSTQWTGLSEESVGDLWRARELNPSRVACKASLRPGGPPWRRTSRGRLSRRACVRPSSGRQDSNLPDRLPKPGANH